MTQAAPAIDIDQARTKKRGQGGVVYCLHDLELMFSEWLLNTVTDLYHEGESPEEIGERVHRDPDEIFIALFHQARQGKLNKSFAYRI